MGKPDVVDRHRADPDPTFHFDADPDPIPDSTPSFTHIGISKENFGFFIQSMMPIRPDPDPDPQLCKKRTDTFVTTVYGIRRL